MPVSLFAVVVDCGDPLHQAEFWAQALGFTMSRRNPDEYQFSDPAGNGGSLYFMKVPESKTGKNRLHLDLLATGSMEAEVARLTDAGARMVEVRQDPASRQPRYLDSSAGPRGKRVLRNEHRNLDRLEVGRLGDFAQSVFAVGRLFTANGNGVYAWAA